MDNDLIKVQDSLLINYALDNILQVKSQLITEFIYSKKVYVNDNFEIGLLFGKENCRVFYFNNNNHELIDINTKSYYDFISDLVIQKFKKQPLPNFLIRYKSFSNNKIREIIIEYLILGKIEVKFNQQLNEVECYWKKPKISFLVNSENEIYDVIKY